MRKLKYILASSAVFVLRGLMGAETCSCSRAGDSPRVKNGAVVDGGSAACGTTTGQYLLNDVLKNPPPAKLFYLIVAENLADAQKKALAALKAARPDAVFIEQPTAEDLKAESIAARACAVGAHLYVRPNVANVCAAEGYVMIQAQAGGTLDRFRWRRCPYGVLQEGRGADIFAVRGCG